MELNDIQETVKKVSDIVNSFNDDPMDTFIRQMTFQHKTLQQSFTKLCLKWIETVASAEYRFDGRNQHSHELCEHIITTMKLHDESETELSKQLPCI
jgi:hypothetical protein